MEESDNMNRLESKEDYLERILMLTEKQGSVRAIDIANDMNYSKPSVSIALKKLKNEGYIIVDINGNISLTKDGYVIASEIYERHKIISSALIMIGVDEAIAKEDACRIEHDISNETFIQIKKFLSRQKN